MNIIDLHPSEKEVSAFPLFKGELGTSTAMQLQKDGALKEHKAKTPVLLVCVTGNVTYEDATPTKVVLEPGDYVMIPPNVKHWLVAAKKSQLLLLK